MTEDDEQRPGWMDRPTLVAMVRQLVVDLEEDEQQAVLRLWLNSHLFELVAHLKRPPNIKPTPAYPVILCSGPCWVRGRGKTNIAWDQVLVECRMKDPQTGRWVERRRWAFLPLEPDLDAPRRRELLKLRMQLWAEIDIETTALI